MTSKAGRDVADILIELLGKVPDAATLEVLLEPRHLLQLLRAQGWTDDDIRRDLTAGGRAPGELLLAVLAKEPDTKVLMDLLGNPAPSPKPARVQGRGIASGSALLSGTANWVGRIVMGLLLAVPSGWFLFVRLDVLHFPGLIVHFKGAYVLLFSALVGGLLLIASGVRGLLRR